MNTCPPVDIVPDLPNSEHVQFIREYLVNLFRAANGGQTNRALEIELLEHETDIWIRLSHISAWLPDVFDLELVGRALVEIYEVAHAAGDIREAILRREGEIRRLYGVVLAEDCLKLLRTNGHLDE